MLLSHNRIMIVLLTIQYSVIQCLNHHRIWDLNSWKALKHKLKQCDALESKEPT